MRDLTSFMRRAWGLKRMRRRGKTEQLQFRASGSVRLCFCFSEKNCALACDDRISSRVGLFCLFIDSVVDQDPYKFR